MATQQGPSANTTPTSSARPAGSRHSLTDPALVTRLHKTKAALLAVSLTLAGVLLMMLGAWLAKHPLGEWGWLQALPLGELGGTLFGAGLLGTLFEYAFRKEQDEASADRFRQIIHEQAPSLRDAVIEGFAINKQDLARVATPELLDTIAANALSLRLGDDQFAGELYGDIRDQAIRAEERWHDVVVRVRLSKYLESSTDGTTLLAVTVEWEYTTTPAYPVRRFACVSDRAEYNELLLDIPTTSPWLVVARDGVDPRSRQTYELLELTADGHPQPIRRSQTSTGQTYHVQLNPSVVTGRPVRLRHVFRTVAPTWSHRIFVELPQPARGFNLAVDYTDTSIAEMKVSDTVGSLRPPLISYAPAGATGKSVSVEASGWLMPKTGFSFVWTLQSELPQAERGREAVSRAGLVRK